MEANATSSAQLPLMELTAIAGNDPASLNAMQQFLLPLSSAFSIFWWFAWFVVLFYVIRFAWKNGERA